MQHLGREQSTLVRFFEQPSPGGWLEFVQGMDPVVRALGARDLVEAFLAAGLHPEQLFLATSAEGVPPEAVVLLDLGLVRAEVVWARAALAEGAEQLAWAALAQWISTNE